MKTLTVNGAQRSVDAEDDTPLLWVLREDLALPGTKFGCGIGMCGACTVHIDGEAVRSCQMPVSSLESGQAITTIEALAGSASVGEGELHPLQQAWIDEQVPQCGYCQTGMIMAAAALLKENPEPDEAAIREGITNLCRCGTYPRIVRAIQSAGRVIRERGAAHARGSA
ncbi:(2Fe-2S)-binding protein [Novosphingobium profundi]|uniref:(2Fe-2S)-binding protein n=1 Tax=Novosphingobium profundi TaxID=1774954 RepID=UPI001BDA6A00|nr:(2Fe-2S)-binding protein [Novosphingobium profundi]MBT0671388.1 (2Fe-2S)-binding protein [Novosphingobium profundi]